MSKEGTFLIYAIEAYRAAKHASGRQVATLFRRYGVDDYLMSCYEALHTTGESYLVADIDRFIANRKRELV